MKTKIVLLLASFLLLGAPTLQGCALTQVAQQEPVEVSVERSLLAARVGIKHAASAVAEQLRAGNISPTDAARARDTLRVANISLDTAFSLFDAGNYSDAQGQLAAAQDALLLVEAILKGVTLEQMP